MKHLTAAAFQPGHLSQSGLALVCTPVTRANQARAKRATNAIASIQAKPLDWARPATPDRSTTSNC